MTKRRWCKTASLKLAGANVEDQVSWILKNEAKLLAGKMRTGFNTTRQDVGCGNNVGDHNSLTDSWQMMVNDKLFQACEKGDSELEKVKCTLYVIRSQN